MVGERRFTKDEIESAFHEIGERAIALGHVIELSVYGGAAIMLAYAKRQMTRDVDAVSEQSKQVLNKISRDIAAERGWPEDWLNDGVKGWISSRDGESESNSNRLFRSYPAEDNAGLRVMVAAPRYLFDHEVHGYGHSQKPPGFSMRRPRWTWYPIFIRSKL